MENENSKKKTTAPDTSVGADDGQPLHNPTENSISAFDEMCIRARHTSAAQILPRHVDAVLVLLRNLIA